MLAVLLSGSSQLKIKSDRVVELQAANEELNGRLQETLASLERYELLPYGRSKIFCFVWFR